MRSIAQGDGLTVRAIAGTNVVLFAMDVAPAARTGLLGFAIGTVRNGAVAWLEASKVFRSVVPAPDPGAKFLTIAHPVQSLIWSDFVAHTGGTTTYRVAPVHGTPAQPALGAAVDIAVTTEDPATATHGVYFNRGAIGSQAFSEHFHNQPPERIDDPADPRVRFLSRGMLEAALGFIAQARPGDRLQVAAYEFTYAPVLLALKAAAAAGVTVQIVHEAGTDHANGAGDPTEATKTAAEAIARLGLDRQPGLTLIPRTKRRKIPHNKFIVLVRGGAAVEVLAGSANFTDSGFLGQSNVVHIVRDSGIAAQYLAYWTQLAADPTTHTLSTWTKAQLAEADVPARLAAPGTVPFFSPRKNDSMLAFYAGQIGGAAETAMLTAAFGVNKTLAARFAIPRPFVRFLLLEDHPDADLKAALAGDPHVMAAYGSLLGAFAKGDAAFPPSSLDAWFLKEELFRKQGFVFYIHSKFLLIDPLTDDPLVCTGSANFSTSSLKDNDENMLLIRGDTAVADIYLTEFDRLFRHFFAREAINAAILAHRPIDEAKFLAEDDGWLASYVRPGASKTVRQRLFFPDWPN